MDSQRRFLRALFGLSLVAITAFGLEFVLEWYRLGQPDLAAMNWADTNNAKLVDVLSPMARAYNNMLAMLLATIGLAIPLTANMHTPKLIEMFLRDRINQVVLTLGALGAAHVLWVDFLIGPHFAPVWEYRLAVVGAIAGWIVVVPYFFYVVRFVDPSNILARLQEQVGGVVEQVERGLCDPQAAHPLVHERLHQIGTLILKAIDRADRGVALEGIWALKRLLDHYGQHKAKLLPRWFQVDRQDFVGLSADALALVNADRTWFEHKALSQLFLAYQSALIRNADVIAAISDATRVIAVHAAGRHDDPVLNLTVKFFNTYLREAIKRKDLHAVYDVFYQYRVLAAEELREHPQVVADIGRRFVTYSDYALDNGLAFVPLMAGFDLGWIVCQAYQSRSPVAGELLDSALALRQKCGPDARLLGLKAQLMLGAYFLAHRLAAEAERVRTNLGDVPRSALDQAERDLTALDEPVFWEVTARQMNFEWVPPEQRPFLQAFVASLRP
jgi:hypothetical protein